MKSFATLPADARRVLARRELRRRQLDDEAGMICGIRLALFTDDEIEEGVRIIARGGGWTPELEDALRSDRYVMSETEEAEFEALIQRVKARITSAGGP